MANQVETESNPIKKWVVIIGAIAVVMVIAVGVLAVVLSSTNSKLADTEAQVASLQSTLSSTESKSASLQTELASAKAQIATLSGSGTSLQQTVARQAEEIKAQAEQIKTMRYPKNFATPEELANWLQKDNTNTLYVNPSAFEKALMAFMLQIKAGRDGYILTVNLPMGGTLEFITNRAVVGDVIYEVRASDDFAQRWTTINPAMPSYPITVESGK